MAGKNGLNKLNGNQDAKNEICLCMALGYNSELISEHIKDEFDVEVTRQNIYKNYIKSPKWSAKAQRMAEAMEKEVMKHPLAKKINRLNVLQRTINECFIWRLDKIYFDKNGKEVTRIEKRQIGNIANLIREARTEVEGDKLELIGDLKFEHSWIENKNSHANNSGKA